MSEKDKLIKKALGVAEEVRKSKYNPKYKIREAKLVKGKNSLLVDFFKKVENPPNGTFKSPSAFASNCIMDVTLTDGIVTEIKYDDKTFSEDQINNRDHPKKYAATMQLIKKLEPGQYKEAKGLGEQLGDILYNLDVVTGYPTEFWEPYPEEEMEEKRKLAMQIFEEGKYKPFKLKETLFLKLKTDQTYYRFCPRARAGVAFVLWRNSDRSSSNYVFGDDDDTVYHSFKQIYREKMDGEKITQFIYLKDSSELWYRDPMTASMNRKSSAIIYTGGKRRTKRTKRTRRHHKS